MLTVAAFRPIDHDEGQYVGAVAMMRFGLPYRDFAYLQTPLQPLLFAPLAVWDVRLAAMAAMVAAVTLTATVFRLSIDSSRLRSYFKHAEWHYFWYVFAIAVWAIADRVALSA